MAIDAQKILDGLGGKENVTDLESCITRLRVEVRSADAVDESALRASGAFGVVVQEGVIQVVVGPAADALSEEIEALCR